LTPSKGSPASENSSPVASLRESVELVPVLLPVFLINAVSGSTFFEHEEKPTHKSENKADDNWKIFI
jgi:hypothetical protein